MDDEPGIDIIDDRVEQVPDEIPDSDTLNETCCIAPAKWFVKLSVRRFGQNAVGCAGHDNDTKNLRDDMYGPEVDKTLITQKGLTKKRQTNQVFLVALLLLP
jgi:hypothetical protein